MKTAKKEKVNIPASHGRYAIISVDVEEWYHTYFPTTNVDRQVSTLDGLDIILDILDQYKIKGSFFVIAELAEKIMEKLQAMDKFGHDIACHGVSHLDAKTLSLAEFESRLIMAKEKLEKVLGHSIKGYRAPSFSIDDERFSIVRKCGFKYDSSLLKPQLSKKYGSLKLPEFTEVSPNIYKDGDFTEFEVSTQKFGPANILLGGGYLRMLPWFSMKAITKSYLKTGKPYVLYIHPVDVSQQKLPKIKGITLDRLIRTQVGRKQMVKRFKNVLDMLQKQNYQFVTFEELRKRTENL